MAKKQNDPTRHHFVPKFLLSHFVDAEERVWVYDAVSKKCRPSSPRNAGYENDLHTIVHNGGVRDRKSIEDLVTKLYDTPGSVAIEGLLRRECLDEKRRDDFLKFVAAQMMRTPQAIHQQTIIGKAIMTESGRRMAAYSSEFRDGVTQSLLAVGATTLDIERMFEDMANGELEVVPNKDFVLLMNLSVVTSVASDLTNLTWSFFSVYPTDPDLLIGDHPVTFEDVGSDHESGSLGYSNRNIAIILPLSKRMAAVARWSGQSSYGVLLKGMATMINERTMRFARRFIYASIESQELLDKVVCLHGTGPSIMTKEYKIGDGTMLVSEYK